MKSLQCKSETCVFIVQMGYLDRPLNGIMRHWYVFSSISHVVCIFTGNLSEEQPLSSSCCCISQGQLTFHSSSFVSCETESATNHMTYSLLIKWNCHTSQILGGVLSHVQGFHVDL